MQNKSRAKKAAKTRAKNVRLGAKMGRTIEARQQAEKATMEKRAKAYLDMENDVCELANSGKAGHGRIREQGSFLVRGRPPGHHGPALPGKLLRGGVSAPGDLIRTARSDRPPGSPRAALAQKGARSFRPSFNLSLKCFDFDDEFDAPSAATGGA